MISPSTPHFFMQHFSLPALTLRNSAAPLLSDERHRNIFVATSYIDYNDPLDVREAHQRITYMGPLDRFCDWAFHCGDKARSLHAFATLILYGEAEEKRQTTEHIEQSREDAYQTLAESLSPTGQEMLVRAGDADGNTNEFTYYLSPADRLCLAGWVNVRYAHNQNNPALYAKSAEAFGQAASAHAAAQRPMPAAEAYVSAGHAHAGVGAIAAATNVRMQAAFAFLRVHQHEQAARPYMQAARGYLLEGNPSAAGHAYARAGACYEQIGGDYRTFAIGAYENSAKAYTKANDPASAAESLEAAGRIFSSLAADQMRNGSYATAVGSASSARAAFVRAGREELAADTQLMVADAHRMAGEYVKAAQVAAQAASAHADLGLHLQAAKIWFSVSQWYEQVSRREDSASAMEEHSRAIQKHSRAVQERALANSAARRAPPVPDALPVRDARPVPDVVFARDPQPVPDALPARDPQPVPDVMFARAAKPVPDVLFARDAQPVPDALPVRDAQPVPDALPVRDAQPVPDALPMLAVQPVPDALPALDGQPVLDALPVLAAQPVPYALPALDGQPAVTLEQMLAAPAAAWPQFIRDVIAARQDALVNATDNPPLESGRYKLLFPNARCPMSYETFDKDANVAWCLMATTPARTHLLVVTEKEALRMIGNRWLDGPVQSSQVIHGARALAILMGQPQADEYADLDSQPVNAHPALQIENASVPSQINAAIAAREQAFSRAVDNGLAAGEDVIYFKNGMSLLSLTSFHQHDPVEWCLLRREWWGRKLDLVTLEDALDLVGKAWYGPDPVQDYQVIRGEAALELLMAAHPPVDENAHRAP